MTILEVENQTLRQRTRELEMELRQVKDAQGRLTEENEQLKERIKVLERQLQPGLDGRVHERIDAVFRVDSVNSRGEVAMGVARNVSLGGAFIETDLRLLPGEFMVMTFELRGRPYKIRGEVVRVMENGFGVRFSIDPQQQAHLQAAIAQL